MNDVKLVKKELFQGFDIETYGVKIGKAEIDINRNMITRLEILEPYRGKGYGTEVVKQLSEQWNCDSLWVERSTRHSNQNIRARTRKRAVSLLSELWCRNGDGKMSKCETCKELNEEKEQVTITEIKISGWYYHWCRDILYCPTCGKKITHKTERENKE